MGRLSASGDGLLIRGARNFRAALRMIQFEHTLFALPFAFTGAVLAARGVPAWDRMAWILLAMVGARSAAMTFNRLADLPYDARNPRTSSRPLVTGTLPRGFALLFLIASCGLFILSAAMLDRLALLLSFPVLALILGYSYAKRFTWGSHFFLGACLGCAPLGAWIAIRGRLDLAPGILGAAVLFWTAGFDILYACQDVEFDRKEGLHSIPSRWGIRNALVVARSLHLLMIAGLVITARLLSLGTLFLLGVAGTALMLLYEHSLVRHDDLTRLNRAFFTVNGAVSIFLFAMTLADLLKPL